MDTGVLELPVPTATRLRRPGWRDPRLLAGIALVAASVALGAWVVRSAQATVPVYAARHALVAGDEVRPDDLRVIDVRGVDLDRYLRADRPLGDGVAVRTVGAGELVPRDAVGAARDVDVRSVAVPLTGPPGKDLRVGAAADLWFTPKPDPGHEVTPPRQVAAGLTIAEVATSGGAFGAGAGPSVHLLVPSAGLPAVLAALAGDGTLDVVVVPGSGD